MPPRALITKLFVERKTFWKTSLPPVLAQIGPIRQSCLPLSLRAWAFSSFSPGWRCFLLAGGGFWGGFGASQGYLSQPSKRPRLKWFLISHTFIIILSFSEILRYHYTNSISNVLTILFPDQCGPSQNGGINILPDSSEFVPSAFVSPLDGLFPLFTWPTHKKS